MMSLDIHYNVYGCFREPLKDVKLAKYAVDAGFQGIWIGDHFMPWIDSRPYAHHVLPWLGTLMNEVSGVPVGTSVTCPMFRYHPPLLGQAVATLDNMYPGRFKLGLGTGEALNELHFTDDEWPDWRDRADMMIEAIEIMRELWNTDDHLSYYGKHYQYEGIKLYTLPKKKMEVHWAAWGPTSSKFAGRYADHLTTSAGADRIENSIYPNVKAGLEEVGRDIIDIDITTEVVFNYGDPDELVQDIRDRGENIPHGHRDTPDPRKIQAAGEKELAKMTDSKVRETNNISDDTEEFIKELERLEDAGATHALVGSNAGEPRATIDAFETEVLPHFE